MIDVESVAENVEDSLKRASEARSAEVTFYYGCQAIAVALIAILQEVNGLRRDLKERT
jgi:hypothetical protein